MGRKKILLIDDSQTQILYEKMMLSNSFDIITASNGNLGVATAVKERPDLILLDVVMPEMDGVECLKSMRAQEETKNIPIIMVTSKSDQSRIDSCFQLGCNDYITKPVDRTELKNKVQKQLHGAP